MQEGQGLLYLPILLLHFLQSQRQNQNVSPSPISEVTPLIIAMIETDMYLPVTSEMRDAAVVKSGSRVPLSFSPAVMSIATLMPPSEVLSTTNIGTSIASKNNAICGVVQRFLL